MTDEFKFKPSWIDYKNDGKNRNGEEIGFIHSQTIAYIVYELKKDKSTAWEINTNLCPNHTSATSLYKALSISILKKSKNKPFQKLLVADLIKALSAQEPLNEEDMFQESVAYLNNLQHDIVHFRYVATALLCTLLLLAPSIVYFLITETKDDIYQILNGVFFGSAGSFVSILQRYNSIIIPKYSTWRFTLVRSIARIIIGAIFGGLFIITNKAGIILNIVSGNFYLAYTFAFISGLSERFFPDLLEKTADRLTNSRRDQNGKY